MQTTDERWIDAFVYQGYREHGLQFMRSLDGRFSVVVEDRDRGVVFLARDWIGESPMHTLATPTGLYVANAVKHLKDAAPNEYTYAYVRAFPQSYVQEIGLGGVEPGCVALTMRPEEPRLYFDFAARVRTAEEELASRDFAEGLETLASELRDSVRTRARAAGPGPIAVLLSGGLDSFTIALSMKAAAVPFEAYTLSVNGQGSDVAAAVEFAQLLGVPHHIIDVTADEIVAAFDDAVCIGESYHLFNVYCTVGMLLIGRDLSKRGVRTAFCGEAVNEAVGDYKDWTVRDPRTHEWRVLQHVDHDRLEQIAERALYVWGHPIDRGKYNRQLGTGLAKHAGARMFKPLKASGITLECPYYNSHILARLVSIPPSVLQELGGKPGIMAHALRRELDRFGIPHQVVLDCKKVRLQDASEGGDGGLTPVLLEAGCDQRRTIEVFNTCFSASLDPVLDAKRLALTS